MCAIPLRTATRAERYVATSKIAGGGVVHARWRPAPRAGDSPVSHWSFGVHLQLADEWTESRMHEQQIKFTIGP
jgi:hypothetical protein